MDRPSLPAELPLSDLALDKLTRVLGDEKGRRVYGAVLLEAGLREIRTPNDLYLFGERLSQHGGFEAAVGGMLGVAAVLRGASARKPSG